MDYRKNIASHKETNRSNRSAAASLNHGTAQTVSFIDKRSSTAAQLKLIEGMSNTGTADPAQRVEDEELLQDKLETAQRVFAEEKPLQGKFSAELIQQKPEAAPNNTGLPNNLKAGIENLSGYSMDDVKVHYNSDKPSQLQAHAYAQGTDIHVAPGQDKHLPHEAWHVVQQKQGRVKPTMQMKQSVPVNDDAGLEKEADVMGGRALQMKKEMRNIKYGPCRNPVLQREIDTSIGGMTPAGPIPANGFTGLPVANKTVNRIQATTSPADPPGMSVWKNRGYLRDPSKPNTNQSLTRMHAIRGKFGGPSAANNMFLGTALSNNFHGQSHYREVEQPLERYLKGGTAGERRAFDYTVAPNFGLLPPYMVARIHDPNQVNPAEQAAFNGFANQHIPNGFTCTAVLYRDVGGVITSKRVDEVVATDVGVPNGGVPVNGYQQIHAEASESGVLGSVGYGVGGAIVGGLAATALAASGPVGWVMAGAVIGVVYGYATAEDD